MENVTNTKNVVKNVANENLQDLTERWLKKQIPEGEYYVELSDGSFDYLIYVSDDDPEIDRDVMQIKRVIAPVPSYEQWQAFNENMDSAIQTNKTLAKRLKDLKESNDNNVWLYQNIIRKRDAEISDLNATQSELSRLMYECKKFLTDNMPENKKARKLANKINETFRTLYPEY